MRTLVLLALIAAAPPKQFNLVCAGKTDVIAPGGNSQTPYSRVLRIDLASGQWCAAECVEVEPIARVEPGRLVLRDVKRSPRSAFSSGHCEAALFTGFTSGATKF